ncbi:MAG: cytochrome c oxidase assembly protein [Limnochordaceae bacterium]|nr:cytochrome c oxidase assembly protein [Limnochordaceae bacterium]
MRRVHGQGMVRGAARGAAGALAVLAWAAVARAHGGDPHPEAVLRWTDWHVEPGVLVVSVLACLAYARIHRLFGGTRRQAGRWALGVAVVYVALESPLDRGADHFLFTLHMAQHFLLIMVAAPLLASAIPERAWGRARGLPFVGSVLRWIGTGAPAFVAYNLNLVAWHLPALYEAGLRSDAVHAAQHLLFLVTALGMWSVVMAPAHAVRATPPARLAGLVASSIVDWLVSFAIALAGRPLYPTYAAAPRLWGLSPEADLALGGGLMWVADNTVYAVAIGSLLSRYLRREAARARVPDGAAEAPSSVRTRRPATLEALHRGRGRPWGPALTLAAAGALAVAFAHGVVTGSLPGRAVPSVRVEAVAAGLTWYFVYPGSDGRFGRIDAAAAGPGNPAGLDPSDPAGRDDLVLGHLVVPPGVRVEVRATSLDTVHSFAIPEIGLDRLLMPDRWESVVFRAPGRGRLPIVCTQLCGMDREPMASYLAVTPSGSGAGSGPATAAATSRPANSR